MSDEMIDINNIAKKIIFFDKNEGPHGTLSEQSISCFSHCAATEALEKSAKVLSAKEICLQS